ncbi:MAG TPA: polyhydroxyalkanoic acid system family protein [Ramlibacter sp.]|uniref:polyhydroxyalkanoic acid system family protein n=1 Tax=Ramlibacter sp. TaxID=1917967 RepID=UPI002B983796|nr:polyhydroxyalkanoic acid system family protein [Ramlibacter sp.]HVZ42297.1 polyhydroxyalkanoic acid system family protein [Ramlibacter sp.]
MADIHIERRHAMGLAQARKLAFKWAETAEDKLGMECTYEEGRTTDVVTFTRAGVNGELTVTKDSFVLDARLGFLLGAFKEKIEGEIVKNLDKLLAHKDPHDAFEKGLAKHHAAAEKKAAAAKKPATARKKAK